MTQAANNLKQLWQDFRTENPKTRIRDAASQLGVSEAELLATGCGENCTRLRADWKGILNQLPLLKTVMALTRSDALVHEVTGHYMNPSYHGNTALFFRPGQDTRYFLNDWKYAFAVNENERLSLQFFDQWGHAIHKIYLTDSSDIYAYQKIKELFKHEHNSLHLPSPPSKEHDFKTTKGQGSDFDSSNLREAWANIKDVHEGNRIIKKNGGDRQAIYQALGDDYARYFSGDTIEPLLEHLAKESIPLMLFGMNNYAVQSFAGTIHRLHRMGPWLNVLDPTFNLHLRTGDVGEVWHIRKPSEDGWINSLDVFDKQGREIMVITYNRKRGEKEPATWAEVIQNMQ